MAQGVNKVILVGNLGRDPELRYTQSGTAVANFTLATNYRARSSDGEWEDRTEWHRIVAWGKLAEIVGQHLSKGRQVYVDGRLQTRQWEDRDGNTRYTTEVKADTLLMLGRRGDDEGFSEPGGPPPDSSGGDVTDDDIPF